MMKKRWLKLMSVLLCFAMFMTFAQTSLPARAQSVSDLENQLADINKKQEELEKEMNSTQNKIDAEKQKQQQLETQADLTRDKISVLQQKLDLLTTQISDQETTIETLKNDIQTKEQEIETKKAEIDKQCDDLMEYMRTMYMNDEVSTLDLLLGAESFGDFLSTAENIKRMTAYNKEIMDELDRQYKELEKIKQEKETARTQAEQIATELEKNKQDLESEQAEFNSANAQLQGQIQASQASAAAMESELKKLGITQSEYDQAAKDMENEIQKIYDSMSKPGDDTNVPNYDNQSFLWPVAGNTYVSSYYGWRFNNTDFHTGIDITMGGAMGKPIRAAKSGVVTYVGWAPRGYGNYFIVDHGGGYSTLYAHCSSVYVSEGQTVSQGETVAAIGSTGWSTGPHLHFEIRVGGQHVNPLNFF